MPSKYTASIKVRLSRVVNFAILLMALGLIVVLITTFVIFEGHLIDFTKDSLSDLRKEGLEGTIYERGSQISDQF